MVQAPRKDTALIVPSLWGLPIQVMLLHFSEELFDVMFVLRRRKD